MRTIFVVTITGDDLWTIFSINHFPLGEMVNKNNSSVNAESYKNAYQTPIISQMEKSELRMQRFGTNHFNNYFRQQLH